MAAAMGMNSMVLRHGEQFFGDRREVHIWLTHNDYDNANLMVLLAYILLGHPDWSEGEINIYAAVPLQEVELETATLTRLIDTGRLPVSRKNMEIIPTRTGGTFSRLVSDGSSSRAEDGR